MERYEKVKRQIKGLNKRLLYKIVKTILSYKSAERIVLFGSRAKGSYSDISDVDIAIFGKEWSHKDTNIIKNKLDENINTPLKFDVINFYLLTKKSLKEKILKEGKLIYESRKD